MNRLIHIINIYNLLRNLLYKFMERWIDEEEFHTKKASRYSYRSPANNLYV